MIDKKCPKCTKLDNGKFFCEINDIELNEVWNCEDCPERNIN